MLWKEEGKHCRRPHRQEIVITFCYLSEDEGCGVHRTQSTWSLKTSITTLISYLIHDRLITFQMWSLQHETTWHCLMIIPLDGSPFLQHWIFTNYGFSLCNSEANAIFIFKDFHPLVQIEVLRGQPPPK